MVYCDIKVSDLPIFFEHILFHTGFDYLNLIPMGNYTLFIYGRMWVDRETNYDTYIGSVHLPTSWRHKGGVDLPLSP